MLTTHVVYEGTGTRPMTVARVECQDLVVAVAIAAIREMELAAISLLDVDEMLALAKREDAERLRRVLSAMLPAEDWG